MLKSLKNTRIHTHVSIRNVCVCVLRIEATKNICFFLFKKPDLHNSSFTRVWSKTNITVRFVKQSVDFISQRSKRSSDDPFHEDFDFSLAVSSKSNGFLTAKSTKPYTFHPSKLKAIISQALLRDSHLFQFS